MGWYPTFSTIVVTIKFADLQKIDSAGHLVLWTQSGIGGSFFQGSGLGKGSCLTAMIVALLDGL